MRSMLNSIQGFKNEKLEKVTVADVIKYNSVYKDVYELIFTSIDPIKNYQYIFGNYSTKVDDVLASFSSVLSIDFDFNIISVTKFFSLQKQVDKKVEILKKQLSKK
jgi:hypothetical protein